MKKTRDQWLDAMTEVCKEVDAQNAPTSPEVKDIESIEQKLMDRLTEKLDNAVDSAMTKYAQAHASKQPDNTPTDNNPTGNDPTGDDPTGGTSINE